MSNDTAEYIWLKEDGTFEHIVLDTDEQYLVVEEMDADEFFLMENFSDVLPTTTKKYKKYTTKWGHYCVPMDWEIKILKQTGSFSAELTPGDAHNLLSMNISNRADNDGITIVAFDCNKTDSCDETMVNTYLAEALGFKK